MTELERAKGGKDIRDRLALSNEAYRWLIRQENPETIHKMEYAEELINDLFEGQDVEIITEKDDILNPLMYDHASIEVSGKDILLHNPSVIAKLGELCASISFGPPRTNGCVTVSFNFDKLVKKVDI